MYITQPKNSDVEPDMLSKHVRYPASKRAFDVLVSVISIGLLLPFLCIVFLLVRATSAGPAIYRQERVGLGGKPFTIYKFRTMRVDSSNERQLELSRRELSGGDTLCPETKLYKLGKDDRITRVGRTIRKLSLDELPQLFNVLNGSMSIVGPRPHIADEVDLFPCDNILRHSMPPGITGLWQVSGRNRMSMLDMLKLDMEYVENWSMLLDVKILLATPLAVLRINDAS